MIYLDNAATSWPKPPCVAEAMVRFLNEVGANPGRSGHSRNPCGPEQRIDLIFKEQIHDFGKNQTGCRGNGKCNRAQKENSKGFRSQKNVGLGAAAHCKAQENGGRIDNGRLGRIGKSVDNPAFL